MAGADKKLTQFNATARLRARAARAKARQEKLAVRHFLKSAEARAAELEMCGLPGAAKAITKIIREK